MNEITDLKAIAALAYSQLSNKEKETITTDYVCLLQESVKKEKKEMIPAELHFIELAQELAFEQRVQTKFSQNIVSDKIDNYSDLNMSSLKGGSEILLIRTTFCKNLVIRFLQNLPVFQTYRYVFSDRFCAWGRENQ